MTPTLSVIAPCLNEQDNIGPLVTRTLATLAKLPVPAELILVDDGSTDRTWEQISRYAARDPRVVGVHHATNRGMEAGWRSGIARAAGELVCLIDADLQNRPEDIARLYEVWRASDTVDLVQGVRVQAEGARRLLRFSQALNFLLNASFGTRLRDNKSGFILCRRQVLEDILKHRFRYRYFQSFLGVAACTRGYRIAEVETVFDDRTAGQSFLSRFPVIVSLRVLAELVKCRLELRRNTSSDRSGDRSGPVNLLRKSDFPPVDRSGL